MKKIVDNTRMIFRCCKLYYEKNMTQQEICKKLEISRPTVSRMLQAGREKGYVRIELIDPNSNGFEALEEALERRYGLKEAIIVPTESGEHINGYLGKEAFCYLNRVLKPGSVLGVSMGNTLKNLLRAADMADAPVDCTVVPIIGGLNEEDASIHANYLSAELASIYGGKSEQFYAPAVLADPIIRKGLLAERAFCRLHELHKKLDVIITGVGVPDRGMSSLVRGGYISEEKLHHYLQTGLAGDIALQLFDEKGRTEPFEEHNCCVSGFRLNQFEKVPLRIGIAAGEARVRAFAGALRGGFINIAILDQSCAQALWNLAR